jgi:galactokinase
MSEDQAAKKAACFASLEEQIHSTDHREPMRWFVPGRIEVLGKHTDYAGGRSLLCATEYGFCVAAFSRADSLIRIHDILRSRAIELPLSPDLEIPSEGWSLYPAVVARRIAHNFPRATTGADIVLASDLPSAAGMSSSSALVVAIFATLSAVNHLDDRPEYRENLSALEDLAGYLGCIENGQTYKALVGDAGVGTFGGSQDHTAIIASQPAHLKQYSFCPVRFERSIPVPDDCAFVIGVSGVSADKTGSAKSLYNRASLAVQQILEIWRQTSGSTAVTLAAAFAESPEAPRKIRATLCQSKAVDANSLVDRFEQFWLESETIIPQAADALARSDLVAFGNLVARSQKAAEDLLGNQVPETKWMAREARALGAHAASAFGAGFGGSVWALVQRKDAHDFCGKWRDAYLHSGHAAAEQAEFFVTLAGPPMIRL